MDLFLIFLKLNLKVRLIMDKYTQFLERCDFIEYDTSKKEISEALLKNKTAANICRDLINDECIKDILENKEIKGYIAIIDNKYSGFIFFKHLCDTLYLSLLATKPKLGFPLGQILLTKMEEEGQRRKVYKIQGDSIPQAVSFYEKMKYEVKYFDEISGEFSIQKKLIE